MDSCGSRNDNRNEALEKKQLVGDDSTNARSSCVCYNTFNTPNENDIESVEIYESNHNPFIHRAFRPPKDRWNIIFFIMILHGIGVLLPWNMFITAKDYYVDYKLNKNYTGEELPYANNFLSSLGVFAQIPNFLFNWINLFLSIGGDLTTRIVTGIVVQIAVFLLTVILAMMDSSDWPDIFFWITMMSILVLNTSNGIYQNSVFGMAAKLPAKYTGAIILGSNVSGTFTSIISILALYLAPSERTSAIYYFITAIFVLVVCLDTYFALPANRFYRFYELSYQEELRKKLNNRARGTRRAAETDASVWAVFKQCYVQCINVWFVFFVTLSIFPAVQSDIIISDEDFIISPKYYSSVMCFLTFNVSAMAGSWFASVYQWPSKKYVIVPILLRALFIPLFLICNYVPEVIKNDKRAFVYIDNDWIYLLIAIAMAFSSGYFSSISMMYCSATVEPRYSSTAGMLGAAFLVTGVLTGVCFSWLMPIIVTTYAV